MSNNQKEASQPQDEKRTVWRPRSTRFVGGVAVLLAALLLIMSLPRTLAALISPSEVLQRERMATALGAGPHAMNRAAALELERVTEIGPEAGREPLDRAIELTRRSLASAPAQPRAWERLAYAMIVRDGPSPAAADVIGMSLLTGHELPGHAHSRLSLVLALWSHLRPGDRPVAERLVRDLWRSDPRVVAEFAARYRAEDAVRSVLAEMDGAIVGFDDLLKSY